MSFATLPLGVRLLLVNHLAGNTAFYMLIPFLADYLLDDLGLSAMVVGVILAARNLCQQGLFLVGGSAADRLGARGVIMAGAAVRAGAFALFAASDSLPAVFCAAILTGFAGALFNPAVRSYIAADSADRRSESFAWFNVFGDIGITAGPLLGIALAGFGFRLTALVSAAIFAVLTLGQFLLLPSRPVAPHTCRVTSDWRSVAGDRRFRLFALALMGMFALQMQVYFLLTLQAQQAAGPGREAGAVAALFIAQTVAGVLLQVPVTRFCARRLARGRCIALGLSIMGISFLVPPLGHALAGSRSGLSADVALIPVLLAAVMLALGTMVAQPFVNELIPEFGPARLTGTYFGAFYLLAGIVTFATNTGLGALVDAGSDVLAWPAAAVCAGMGLLSAAAIRALHARQEIPLPPVRAGASL